MKKDQAYATQTDKSVRDYVQSLGAVLHKNGFIIR